MCLCTNSTNTFFINLNHITGEYQKVINKNNIKFMIINFLQPRKSHWIVVLIYYYSPESIVTHC